MGMHANTYYYAGGFDDWFLETDSQLTADDLLLYFKSSLHANGGDAASDVDALAEPGTVTLKQQMESILQVAYFIQGRFHVLYQVAAV
jgi:hypothetical protein